MAVTLTGAVEASERRRCPETLSASQVDVAAVMQVSIGRYAVATSAPERYDRLAQLHPVLLLSTLLTPPRWRRQWLRQKPARRAAPG